MTEPTSEDVVEPDRIAMRAPVLAFVITAAAIILSVAAVWLLLGTATGGGEVADVPATVQPPSPPFAVPTAGELHRAQVRAHLTRWQWADAAHTRVIVPVAVAIDRAAAREALP
jgi:hypothetical protein